MKNLFTRILEVFENLIMALFGVNQYDNEQSEFIRTSLLKLDLVNEGKDNTRIVDLLIDCLYLLPDGYDSASDVIGALFECYSHGNVPLLPVLRISDSFPGFYRFLLNEKRMNHVYMTPGDFYNEVCDYIEFQLLKEA